VARAREGLSGIVDRDPAPLQVHCYGLPVPRQCEHCFRAYGKVSGPQHRCWWLHTGG
jgi:hypothetical protein